MQDVDLFKDKVFSVAELSRLVRDVLEGTFRRVSVEGEVTGFIRAASGHCYFALTERDPGRSGTLRLDCAVFKWSGLARNLDIRDGQKLVASGKVSSWGGSSRYQLVVDSVREAGAGDLLRKLEELKKKLQAEGLFEESRKRPLPFIPRRIGVVTSLKGAAIRDIVRTIYSRFPARILIYPSLVQGDGAAGQVASGIEALNMAPDVDVIIVGRGGGSMEDLWAFNEEALVRAISDSRVPVVSAVGHEADHLLSDDAADARAATPTAAGQMVVPSLEELLEDMDRMGDRLASGLERNTQGAGQRLDEAETRLRHTGERMMDKALHRLEVMSARLFARHPKRLLSQERTRHEQAAKRLARMGSRLLEPSKNAIGVLELRLRPLSPYAPLDRGYALAMKADGQVVNRHDQVVKGDAVDVLLGNGALDCVVEGTREAKRPKNRD